MRKLTVLCMVLALLVGAMVGTALAKNGGGSGGNSGGGTLNFDGYVVSASASAVVVDITKSNGPARQFVGQQKTFVVSSATRVDREEARISATDLLPGEEVSVQSRAPKGTTDHFPARRISVNDDETTGGGTTGGSTGGTTEDNSGSGGSGS